MACLVWPESSLESFCSVWEAPVTVRDMKRRREFQTASTTQTKDTPYIMSDWAWTRQKLIFHFMFDFLISRRQSSASSRPTQRRHRRSNSDIGIKPSTNKATSLPTRPSLPSHQSYFLEEYTSFPSLEDDESHSDSGILSWARKGVYVEQKGKQRAAHTKQPLTLNPNRVA